MSNLTATRKKLYNNPMVVAVDKNRLGVGLAVSLVVHLVLLLFIAAISSVDIKPVVPKSKDFFVEIFDGVVEKKNNRQPKETKRFGRESNRVEKEMNLPSSPSMPEVVSKPQPASEQVEMPKDQSGVESSEEPVTGELRRDVNKETQVPVMQEGLRIEKADKVEKKLPSLKALIPSYDRLAMQISSPDTSRDVEIGNAVSLNTTEFKYISYFSKVKGQIQMVWKYPELARREGVKGVLTLKFSINHDGSLKGVNLLRSSGSSLLDRAAIKAIRDAVPFFPLPDNLGEVLDVVANFEYELSGSNFR